MLLLIEPAGADATENNLGEGLLRGLLACGAAARRVAVADAAAAAAVAREAGGAHVLIDARLLAGVEAATNFVAVVQHESALGPRDPLDAGAYALLSRMRRVLVPGAVVAEALAARVALSDGQILLLPPGSDAAPRSRAAADGDCMLLWRGRCAADAGVLREALRRLPDIEWRLCLALREGFASDDLGWRTRGIDAGDEAAMQRAWQAADVLVVVEEWCASDRDARAAMRRGLPSVVCAGGGAAEGLDPACALGVTPGDSEQLSKALRRMIFDAPLRAQMGEAAWQRGAGLPDWQAQARLVLSELGR